jgi:CubicO group peptidase (beta-lactamase class C family)
MTKLLTTVCVLHLLSHPPKAKANAKEPLTLDTNLLPLIPELAALQILTGFSTTPGPDSTAPAEGTPLLVPNTAPLTLRHLLTHTAGLGIDVADPDLSRWSAWVGRTAHVGSCTLEGWSTPLKFVPGRGGWYYGTGVDWAGVVLERVSGVRLGGYLKGCLGGLGGTGFVLGGLFPGAGAGGEGEKGERYVPVSERDGEGGLKEGVTGFPDEPVYESGGAGLYSNAVDFARVLKGLLGSLAGEEGVLGREVVEEMFKPQLDEVQKQWLRGIVWNFGVAAEVPEGMAIDHGIGGLLAMEDVEGKRRKGSLWWSGMCNSRWVSLLPQTF